MVEAYFIKNPWLKPILSKTHGEPDNEQEYDCMKKNTDGRRTSIGIRDFT